MSWCRCRFDKCDLVCAPSARRCVSFWITEKFEIWSYFGFILSSSIRHYSRVEEKYKWWEQTDWVRLNPSECQIQSLHIVPAHLFGLPKDTWTPSVPRSSALWLLQRARPKRRTGHLGTFWVTVINPATCWHPTLETSYSLLADGSQICEGRFGYFGAVRGWKKQKFDCKSGWVCPYKELCVWKVRPLQLSAVYSWPWHDR